MSFFLNYVKFSLVDGLTGNLLEKTNPSRRVTSYYEGFFIQYLKQKCSLTI